MPDALITRAAYDAACEEIERLFDAEPGTREGDRLDYLIDLVVQFEYRHRVIKSMLPRIELMRIHDIDDTGGIVITSYAEADEAEAEAETLAGYPLNTPQSRRYHQLLNAVELYEMTRPGYSG